MPGFGALMVLLGLGAFAWFFIRPGENRKQSALQALKPQKRG